MQLKIHPIVPITIHQLIAVANVIMRIPAHIHVIVFSAQAHNNVIVVAKKHILPISYPLVGQNVITLKVESNGN